MTKGVPAFSDSNPGMLRLFYKHPEPEADWLEKMARLWGSSTRSIGKTDGASYRDEKVRPLKSVFWLGRVPREIGAFNAIHDCGKLALLVNLMHRTWGIFSEILLLSICTARFRHELVFRCLMLGILFLCIHQSWVATSTNPEAVAAGQRQSLTCHTGCQIWPFPICKDEAFASLNANSNVCSID